jgi:hypothetical protein
MVEILGSEMKVSESTARIRLSRNRIQETDLTKTTLVIKRERLLNHFLFYGSMDFPSALFVL